ncbi:MAG TPA: ubiquitin-like domain-containing protein, partial [Bacilli bacterium]
MRLISAVSLAAIFLLSLFFVLLYGTSFKTVTLVVDGKAQQIHTHQFDVSHLLKEQAVTVGEHDRISRDAAALIKDGDTITVAHAIPIMVAVDGKTEKAYVTSRNVRDALDELQITLNPDDKVYPAAGGVLNAYETLRVVRVSKVIEEKEEITPFATVKTADAKLAKGKVRTIREGVTGISVHKIEKIFEDGKLTRIKVLETTQKQKAVPQVVAVGTMKPVTVLSASSPVVKEVSKNGITFGVKQILKNVTLTAYHAGIESTGKSEGDPEYGITYTGTHVQEGRTIAVDPKVIPLGWWVYIEGIGFRRAEDIGSGVKGKWIDIYYEDGDYADRFGMKKGATVYVIGPVKPT